MTSIADPPNAVLRAHADLIHHVFLFLRNCGEQLDRKQIYDLSDAMHNINTIFVDSGALTDHEKYREIHSAASTQTGEGMDFDLNNFSMRNCRNIHVNKVASESPVVGNSRSNALTAGSTVSKLQVSPRQRLMCGVRPKSV